MSNRCIDPEGFGAFMDEVQDRVRFALIAGHGPELGTEAAADALAYAWEHWDRVKTMDNPAGYVYRVGQRLARHERRRQLRRPPVFPPPPSNPPSVEPGLPKALERLSERQRVSVFLVHGLGYSHQEVADMLGVAKGTVQGYVERGLGKLRRSLGVVVDV
jgi:RNA polymerase sigma-70 factor (ECF subfamily)